MTTVHIVATGVANTASVAAAFQRIGCETTLVGTADEILDVDYLVLPGVGAFAAAISRLGEEDWIEPLRARVADQLPTLAICLGLQLLGVSSAEAADCAGLGCVESVAKPFDDRVRVPHMGWNRVEADPGCELLTSGAAYFAHSYHWSEVPRGWRAAMTRHGESFVAAVERGAVLACQFHPELSGEYGAELIRQWLQRGGVSC